MCVCMYVCMFVCTYINNIFIVYDMLGLGGVLEVGGECYNLG